MKLPAEQGSRDTEARAREHRSLPQPKVNWFYSRSPAPINTLEKCGLHLSFPTSPSWESSWGRKVLAMGLESQAGLWGEGWGPFQGEGKESGSPLLLLTTSDTSHFMRFVGRGCTSNHVTALRNIYFYCHCF